MPIMADSTNMELLIRNVQLETELRMAKEQLVIAQQSTQYLLQLASQSQSNLTTSHADNSRPQLQFEASKRANRADSVISALSTAAAVDASSEYAAPAQLVNFEPEKPLLDDGAEETLPDTPSLVPVNHSRAREPFQESVGLGIISDNSTPASSVYGLSNRATTGVRIIRNTDGTSYTVPNTPAIDMTPESSFSNMVATVEFSGNEHRSMAGKACYWVEMEPETLTEAIAWYAKGSRHTPEEFRTYFEDVIRPEYEAKEKRLKATRGGLLAPFSKSENEESQRGRPLSRELVDEKIAAKTDSSVAQAESQVDDGGQSSEHVQKEHGAETASQKCRETASSDQGLVVDVDSAEVTMPGTSEEPSAPASRQFSALNLEKKCLEEETSTNVPEAVSSQHSSDGDVDSNAATVPEPEDDPKPSSHDIIWKNMVTTTEAGSVEPDMPAVATSEEKVSPASAESSFGGYVPPRLYNPSALEDAINLQKEFKSWEPTGRGRERRARVFVNPEPKPGLTAELRHAEPAFPELMSSRHAVPGEGSASIPPAAEGQDRRPYQNAPYTTSPLELEHLFAEPAEGDRSPYRTVLISNIPAGTMLIDVLDSIKGGKIYSAVLLDTAGMRTIPPIDTNSALVTFVFGRHARFAATHHDTAQLLPTISRPIPARIVSEILQDNLSRVLFVYDTQQTLSPKDVADRLMRNGAQYPLKFESDGEVPGLMLFHYASVAEAKIAWLAVNRDHTFFSGVTNGYYADPCGKPIEQVETEEVLDEFDIQAREQLALEKDQARKSVGEVEGDRLEKEAKGAQGNCVDPRGTSNWLSQAAIEYLRGPNTWNFGAGTDAKREEESRMNEG